MKGKRVHRVPLSGAAMAVLENARKMTGGDGLIFPSDKGKVLSDSTLSKLVRKTARALCRTASGPASELGRLNVPTFRARSRSLR